MADLRLIMEYGDGFIGDGEPVVTHRKVCVITSAKLLQDDQMYRSIIRTAQAMQKDILWTAEHDAR